MNVGFGRQRRDALLLAAVEFPKPRDDLPHVGSCGKRGPAIVGRAPEGDPGMVELFDAFDDEPAEPWLALTAIISFLEEDERTRYSARVMHKNGADSRKHLELGFEKGWGTTIDQLAAFVEKLD